MSIQYSSSVREVAIEETLAHATTLARKLGITRVTNVTRLDRIGVPVCCSIRPGAPKNSLCVNAGKGVTNEEARIGAFMEAIEFALAEFGASHVLPVHARLRDLPNADRDPAAILDFCPVAGKIISPGSAIQCVPAEEILQSGRCFVPAELVYLSLPDFLPGVKIFGSSTNGLASGNSVLEASLHGIAEVIERDITSFQIVCSTSSLVEESTYPEGVARLSSMVHHAGLKLFTRYAPNEFGLPYFKAILYDPLEPTPIYVTAGYGCHVDRGIALTRAVCESIQSRLSFIHGGRDDLTRRYAEFKGFTPLQLREYTNQLIRRASDDHAVVSYRDVPSPGEGVADVLTAFNMLVQSLNRVGINRIYRVVFTAPEEPLHVVRIIIPKLEHYDTSFKRVGVRLQDYVRQAQ